MRLFLTILLPAGSHVYSELLKMDALAVLVTELDGIVMNNDKVTSMIKKTYKN